MMLLVFLSSMATGWSQNVGIGTTSPDGSALLDLSSTSKGFLPPRMSTTERDAIASPVAGLVIFNTSTNNLQLKNSSGWVNLLTPSSTAVFLPTIVIGTQQWMSNNLDVGFYRNGDPIPQVTDPTAWAGLTTGAWCYLNNQNFNSNLYGKLYNWYAVNDPRGLAPSGWHIPSNAEWTTLETTLGGTLVAGGPLKEAGTSYWAAPNTGANNSSGFTGFPGSSRASNGNFNGTNTFGNWWSSSEPGATSTAYGRYLFNNSANLYFITIAKQTGFSVRCIRD